MGVDAFYFNPTSVGLNNPVHIRQAQASPLGFGGKKWLEDIGYVFLGNPISFIFYNYFAHGLAIILVISAGYQYSSFLAACLCSI